VSTSSAGGVDSRRDVGAMGPNTNVQAPIQQMPIDSRASDTPEFFKKVQKLATGSNSGQIIGEYGKKEFQKNNQRQSSENQNNQNGDTASSGHLNNSTQQTPTSTTGAAGSTMK
jgi:hypothetical protein